MHTAILSAYNNTFTVIGNNEKRTDLKQIKIERVMFTIFIYYKIIYIYKYGLLQ